MKLNSDLREFVELLNSAEIEYLIVGGHAVAFHGYPRFTGAIDLWIRPSADNARRVLHALESFGFGGLGLSIADFTTAERVVQLGRPPNRIDLLTSISGVATRLTGATCAGVALPISPGPRERRSRPNLRAVSTPCCSSQ